MIFMVKGAYIHIPFCAHICHYCDFNKYFLKSQPVDEYLEALDQEMGNVSNEKVRRELETIFVGGGTPTALDEKQMDYFLASVRRHLNPDGKIREWTLEANPENMSPAKLQIMKEAGVDRLSVGIQTFNDELLKSIGRAHDRIGAIKSIEEARKWGFTNLSIDLMFGLPDQTKEDLITSLNEAMALAPEHISIYSLQIEPRTVFYNRMKKGTLHLPGQDIEADMYEMVMDFLGSHGYKQYEISNFAKPGFESHHNLLYWENEEYFGFGAGAHGYVNGNRTVNAGAVKGYINRIEKSGHATTQTHQVTNQEKIEEELFLGLRKLSGVYKEHFYMKFGKTLNDIYGEPIKDLKAKGWITEDDEKIALTEKGIFLGNEVFQSFIIS
jgi:oxygen-independent coproporphyrinogen III oxidase